MDNPETLTALGTQDTERRQAKHKNRKLKRSSNTDPTKNRGVTSGADEEWAVPASYKTPVNQSVNGTHRQSVVIKKKSNEKVSIYKGQRW